MPKGIRKLTEEWKKNIGLANAISKKGCKLSEEHKKKISQTMKGYHPVNEIKKGQYVGSENLNWKGGIRKDRGYIYIYKPNHPFCKKGGCVLEHRLVMEKYLRRYLKPEEIVHHDGTKYPLGSFEDRGDNRIENLKLFKNTGKHSSFHRKIDKIYEKNFPHFASKLLVSQFPLEQIP